MMNTYTSSILSTPVKQRPSFKNLLTLLIIFAVNLRAVLNIYIANPVYITAPELIITTVPADGQAPKDVRPPAGTILNT